MSIEHLHEGVDPSALNDFDQFVISMPPGPPPPEFVTSAQTLVEQDDPTTGKQFAITLIISLAELLYQLYTFFQSHHLARQIVKRAAANPHGLAATLVHHKVESRLPDKLKGVPNLASGVTMLTDAALTKAGV